MNRLSLPLIPLILLLASCTGSYEAPNPVLLITGFTRTIGSAAEYKVGIVRDSLAANERGRFTYLPGSERALPAPPQAYDMTNRSDARDNLIVLSRASAAPATTPPSFLSFFATSRLDGSESDPNVGNFKAGRTVDFSDIEGAAIVPRNFPNRDDPLYCPSKIQVTQGGTYAAVLNVPSLCGYGVSQNFIDVLDISGTGRLLQRINNVAEGGLYVSQSSAADILYYATEQAGSLALWRVSLPRPGQAFGPDDTVGTPQSVAIVEDRLAQGNFVDLGVAGEAGSERLVILFQNALAYVTGYTGEGTPDGPVQTADSNNIVVLRDDQLQTSEALVLGTPTAARLSIFPLSFTTDDDNDFGTGEERARVTASAGVIESTSGYTYFVGTNPANGSAVVSLLDLNAYTTGSSPNVQPYTEGLGGLTPAGTSWTPNFLTWAQSLPPATP